MITLDFLRSPLKPLIPIQQNIPVPKITTTFIINSESTQIHDLSLPTTPNWLQKDAKKSSVPKPTSKVVSIAKDAVYDEKIVNTILSSKIPTVKKSLVMTAKSEATASYYPRTRIGPSKKSTLPIAK